MASGPDGRSEPGAQSLHSELSDPVAMGTGAHAESSLPVQANMHISAIVCGKYSLGLRSQKPHLRLLHMLLGLWPEDAMLAGYHKGQHCLRL